MIQNYFKIAWRSLLKNRAFTFINIAGLTIGLCGCLLMILYLQFELSFDTMHSKGDRIARVIMDYKIGGQDGGKGNFTSTKVLPSFKNNFPEVEGGVRMYPTQRLVNYEDKTNNESGFVFADSTFFSVFDFALASGDPNKVLEAPNTVVVSQEAASRYFGKEDPIGKTVKVGSQQAAFVVTGVLEKIPTNSQLKFDFLASLSSMGELQEATYFNANYTTYLLLNSPESITKLQAKLPAFMKKELEELEVVEINYTLEPLLDVHLRSEFDAITPNTNINYIYIIGGMIILLLLIACFTYVNLSTARSLERAKEVGLRKAIGAKRGQLFWQFISESVLVTSISFILSFALALVLLPAFNDLSGLGFNYTDLFNAPVLLGGSIIFICVALLAGSYPALVISGYNPIAVLKGAITSGRSGASIGQTLTVFQFGISIFLIIATLVIGHQMHFIQNKKLGFDKSNALVIDIDGKMIEKMDLIKSELSQIPNVEAVSSSYDTPYKIKGGYNMSTSLEGGDIAVTANPIDEQFIKACGIDIIAGSDLSKQDMLDAAKEEEPYYHFVLNVSGAKALGWTPEEAIGKKMYMDASRPGEVKAVVNDFHFASLHTAIKPLVLFPSTYGSNLIIKVADQGGQNTIDAIANTMKILTPYRPFEYKWMNDEYQKMYVAELRTKSIINVFSAVALFLACLGLFGLATYAIKQRIKEIGVRKVLGASISSLSILVSSHFIKLVVIAFVIVAPIGYFLMNKWLETFAYRVDIKWWVFALAGSVCLGIAVLVVSSQAIKAALMNPVKSLKSE